MFLNKSLILSKHMCLALLWLFFCLILYWIRKCWWILLSCRKVQSGIEKRMFIRQCWRRSTPHQFRLPWVRSGIEFASQGQLCGFFYTSTHTRVSHWSKSPFVSSKSVQGFSHQKRPNFLMFLRIRKLTKWTSFSVMIHKL